MDELEAKQNNQPTKRSGWLEELFYMEVSIKSSSLMSNSTCFSASQCKNCIMWLPPPPIMCFRNRKRYCAPSASPSSLASFAIALSSPYSRVHLHPFPPPSLRPRLAIAIQLHSANPTCYRRTTPRGNTSIQCSRLSVSGTNHREHCCDGSGIGTLWPDSK